MRDLSVLLEGIRRDLDELRSQVRIGERRLIRLPGSGSMSGGARHVQISGDKLEISPTGDARLASVSINPVVDYVFGINTYIDESHYVRWAVTGRYAMAVGYDVTTGSLKICMFNSTGTEGTLVPTNGNPDSTIEILKDGQIRVLNTDGATDHQDGSLNTLGGISAEQNCILGEGITANVLNDVTKITNVPTWLKFHFSHEDLGDPGCSSSSNLVNLLMLPAGGIIHAVKIKHSEKFYNGSYDAPYLISVVKSGGTPYQFINGFDAGTTVSGVNFDFSETAKTFDHVNDIAIDLNIECPCWDDVDDAVQGELDVWVLMSLAI